MNHPYELLADLVDGTLAEENLAGVQAHMDACAACRDDVAHASAGRAAARSLPRIDPPADLHRRVVAAAGGRGRGAPAWSRWAGGAAAAAVVAAVAIALPNLGDGGGNQVDVMEDAAGTTESRATAEGTTGAVDVPVAVQDLDYDEDGLKRLAGDTRANVLSGPESAPAADSADAATAVRCVSEASQGGATGRLTRLIQARFEGRDAYIAVYLERSGADQRPDLAAVWVAARDDCSLLSTAFSRL